MESEDIEIINPRDETSDNAATSARAIEAVSSKWLLLFCLHVLLGHVLYLLMNPMYKMLLKQEAATISNEPWMLMLETMFLAISAGKYIDDAENLVTEISKIKSEMESQSESTKMWIERCCTLDTKNEKLMAESSKLEKEHTTLQQNHEKLIAENDKLVNESKTLHHNIKVKSSSKRKVRSDKVSPRTVDINLS